MAATTFFSGYGAEKYGDYCGDFDFPGISADNQEAGTIRIMSFNIRCGDVNDVHFPGNTGSDA